MKRTKPTTMSIGSVSSGTMREEDLIPAFIWEAKQLRLTRTERSQIKDIEASSEQPGYYQEEDERFSPQEDLQTLFDILDAHCPPYMYFGAHPGDGSDYGCWLSETWEEEFDGARVDDLSEVPRGHSGEVLVVNDHGNASLYQYSRGRYREVWSLV